MDKKENLTFREKISFLWSYAEQFHRKFVFYAFVFLAIAILNSLYPYLTGKIIDTATGKDGFGNLTWQQVTALLVILMAGTMLVKEIMDYFFWNLQALFSSKLHLDVLAHIYCMKFKDLNKRPQGEILAIMNRLENSVQRILETSIYWFLPQIMNLIAALVVIFWLSWPLAIILLVSIILFFVLAYFHKMPEIMAVQKQINDCNNNLNANVTDSINNVSTVKFLVSGERELKVKQEKWQEIIGLTRKNNSLYVSYGMVQAAITIGMKVLSIVWTVYCFQQGTITFGQLVAVTSYVSMAMNPLLQLAFSFRDFRRQLVNIEDAAKIKNAEVEVDCHDAEAHNVSGRISFKGVNFAYPGRDHLTLDDINLEVESGKTLAVVGQTGSGKSTLYKLLVRMFSLKSGVILIDGIDICKIKLGSLRRQICVVEQNPEIFNGTIRENISYGRSDATLEEVRAAAAVAQLDEELMSDVFPDHYETKISGKGSGLSGGQIQRLAIARAILNKPKILVLDEATNSLDLLTKHMILDSLQKFIQGLTTIIISHDLSAMVRQADQIIVMHDGQIVQQGKHEELLVQSGVYSQYWKIQKTI